MGDTGSGTVLDVGTPRHTTTCTHGIAGIHGLNVLGLSKYDYNTISVVIYCNCIVSSNPAIVCIGSVFIAYRIQFIFIINHINQPYYRLRMSLR